MDFLIDTLRNLLVLFRKNHNLIALLITIDNHIRHHHINKHHHHTIDQFFERLDNKIRRTHNKNIRIERNPTV